MFYPYICSSNRKFNLKQHSMSKIKEDTGYVPFETKVYDDPATLCQENIVPVEQDPYFNGHHSDAQYTSRSAVEVQHALLTAAHWDGNVRTYAQIEGLMQRRKEIALEVKRGRDVEIAVEQMRYIQVMINQIMGFI